MLRHQIEGDGAAAETVGDFVEEEGGGGGGEGGGALGEGVVDVDEVGESFVEGGCEGVEGWHWLFSFFGLWWDWDWGFLWGGRAGEGLLRGFLGRRRCHCLRVGL